MEIHQAHTLTPQRHPTSWNMLRAAELQAPRYTSYPTAQQLHGQFSAADFLAALERSNDDPVPAPLSFYLHFPYCAAACFYCGCHRLISRSPAKHAAYLETLKNEIALIAPHLANDRPVQQIHFGGGTPNLLPAEALADLIQTLTANRHITPDCEIAIEADPQQYRDGDAKAWAEAGVNRVSFGVQDLDPEVQRAINRIQPVGLVDAVIGAARAADIHHINVDLVLGLPRQTVSTLQRTLGWLAERRPPRVALYQYAHMPKLFPAQRAIDSRDIPDEEQRFVLQTRAGEALLAAGYVDIGLDHYALPSDPLVRALRDGRLRRNFQGYTVVGESDVVGFGVSAISAVGNCLAQNSKDLIGWKAAIDGGQPAIVRGLTRSEDDEIRADLITQLMCTRRLDTRTFARRHGIEFGRYFATSMTKLDRMDPLEQLLDRRHSEWCVTNEGTQLLRSLAACFDAYR